MKRTIQKAIFATFLALSVASPATADFSPEVLEIQQGLERLGYQSRPFDGLWGRITESIVEEYCSDNSLDCSEYGLSEIRGVIQEHLTNLPQTEIDKLLGERRTINPFLAWNRNNVALERGDYALHWANSPGRGPNTIRLTEFFWNYYYPNKMWLNYEGIEEYLTTTRWGHAAEYGETLATNINSSSFLDFITQIARSRYDLTASHGVMLDWWHDYHAGGFSRGEVQRARLGLITRLREELGENAIILGNVNWRRERATLSELNGVFLELYKEPYFERSATLYTTNELYEIEDLLLYYERQLAYPRIIALEGWRKTLSNRSEDRNTEENRRMAKLLTAMSVVIPTHGYILYADNNTDLDFNDHYHEYYDFYSFDIGRPTSSHMNVTRGVGFKEHDHGVVAYNITDQDIDIRTSDGRDIIVPANSGLFCEYRGDTEQCLSPY